MKYITLIIGLLVVGCEKGGEITIGEPPKAKPVKELTLEEKAVGTYEMKKGEDTYKAVFLANGTMEAYTNGKRVYVCKWNVANGELHIIDKDGKREGTPKEKQFTHKKIQ